MDENDVDYYYFWHMAHWNRVDASTRKDEGVETDVVISTSVIKYQKADWLDGLRDRKPPASLLPWPLIRVDEMA